MDKTALKVLKVLLAKEAKAPTLGDKLDKGLTLATKVVALVALLTTLLTDVATKLLPALELLLAHLPRPGLTTGAG